MDEYNYGDRDAHDSEVEEDEEYWIHMLGVLF